MAKKFVRGITDVKTITNQCYDTNNVNDLLSDGQYNYIHRKKGKTEEYHNLTDNIKTISSDNTDLLTVTNNNKTTNTATLHPKHDAQKQNKLTSNASIAVNDDGLRQLYALKKIYSHTNGILKTHIKAVSQNTTLSILEQEYNFILKINQGSQDATFTLSEHDKNKFTHIITGYGVENAVRINGCLFTLSDSTLTVSTDANTVSNHVITFSDII